MRSTLYAVLFGFVGIVASVYFAARNLLHSDDIARAKKQLNVLQEDQQSAYSQVINTMAAFNMKLEPGTREALAQSISTAVLTQLPTKEAREGFILVLGIESRFGQVRSKSTAGAVGMAQVMPQYAAELGERCGLGRVNREDVDRDIVSLYLGACHFRLLYEQFNGNVALAQAAYNAGTGRVSKLGSVELPEETARYIARSAIIAGSVAKAEPVARAGGR